MKKNNKVIILIPAYNTEKEIFEVFKDLEKVSQFFNEIIIVDDFSKDKTLQNIIEIKKKWNNKKKKIFAFHHKINLGYGGAQKTLYKHFLERKGDIAVLIHSDNQYSPKYIKNLIKPILEDKADIVLASRFYKNLNYHQEMPVYKIIGNRFLTLLENYVLKTNLTEFHTGLRAYSKRFIQDISFINYSNRFVFDSEILFDAIDKKMRISEIPIFAQYKDTFSNVNSIIYGSRILFLIIKYLFKKIFKPNESFIN